MAPKSNTQNMVPKRPSNEWQKDARAKRNKFRYFVVTWTETDPNGTGVITKKDVAIRSWFADNTLTSIYLPPSNEKYRLYLLQDQKLMEDWLHYPVEVKGQCLSLNCVR